MSKVRVLVGTKKGAFILTAMASAGLGGQRAALRGLEMYHLKGSPVEPNRIYASQTSGWFGQISSVRMTAANRNPPGSKSEELIGPGGVPNREQ